MSWNPDRVEQLKQLWDEGLSASQCARVIGGGLTRNAIIGKVHRLGLTLRGREGSPRSTKAAGRSRLKLPPTPLPDEPAPCEPDALVLESGAYVTIATIGPKQCRWPHGHPNEPGFHLCAQPVTNVMSPYCDFHTRRAYNPQSGTYVRRDRDELAEIARNARALEAA